MRTRLFNRDVLSLFCCLLFCFVILFLWGVEINFLNRKRNPKLGMFPLLLAVLNRDSTPKNPDSGLFANWGASQP